ncbi:MAG: hypothetical protein AB7F32_00755 [Victivallaceae bacterium]
MKVRNKKLLFKSEAKPTVFFDTITQIELDFDVDLPAATYNLAIGKSRDPEQEKMATATVTLSEVGRKLLFTVDTGTAEFLAVCKSKAGSAVLEVWRAGAVVLQDDIPISGRADVDGIPPAPVNRFPTFAQVANAILTAVTSIQNWVTEQLDTLSHNTLTGRDAEDSHPIEAITGLQAALDAGGEGSSFYPPVADYVVNDATYGQVYYLDTMYPLIKFERVVNLKKIRLRMVSANPAITGNIVIVPAVDSVDQTPVTLAVGATAETREVEFSTTFTGRFSLRRDHAAAADTLDGVTAIVLSLRILEV